MCSCVRLCRDYVVMSSGARGAVRCCTVPAESRDVTDVTSGVGMLGAIVRLSLPRSWTWGGS